MKNAFDTTIAGDTRVYPGVNGTESPGPRHVRLAHWLLLVGCLVTTSSRGGEPKAGAEGRKSVSSAGEAALVRHLQDAFEEGYIIGPHHQQEAERHLALARRAAPGDPRIDYAHGLVLLKQSHTEAAVAQFDAALKHDGGRYWPAWQAAIWGHLIEKQYEAGLTKLAEYAQVIETAEKSDEVSEAQRLAARWIGQLLEALTLGADSRKVHDLLAAHEAQLLRTFGAELSEEVAAGRESIREREATLEQAADDARQVADRQKERRKQEKASKLEKRIEGLGKTKDEDKKSAEEWKEWLDKTLANADKQLGLLERDYKFLDQRAQSLTQSIMLIGQEITALQVRVFGKKEPDPGPLWSGMQVPQRQSQMLGYQLEYNATIGRMQAVAQQGSFVAEQRAEAILRYETATGQFVQQEADVDKWTTRLKNQKQKLTVQKAPVKGNQKAPAARKHEFSLRAYVSLDFNVEKGHVLASLSPRANEESEVGKPPEK